MKRPDVLSGIIRTHAYRRLMKKKLGDTQANLPEYLTYPNDCISQKILSPHLMAVCDQKCGCEFMLYNQIANRKPEIRNATPAFDLNETHIFWKPGAPSWCAVSAIRGSDIRTADLKSWVEVNDFFCVLTGDMSQILNQPTQMESGAYRRAAMQYLGSNADYNRLHGFQEAHIYCHRFYLGDILYMQCILCAKRDITAWKVECTFPIQEETTDPSDMVLPGLLFGSFFPVA